MRRRVSTILLLPIAVFIFMVGWVLIWMGTQQDGGSAKTPHRKTTVTEEGTTDEYVEVGLIEDLMEKQLEAE